MTPGFPAHVRRPPDVEAETLTISDPLTVQVADLFNAVYETLQTLTHQETAWRILAERLEQLADRLSRNVGLAQLAGLATDLHGMASDIESA